MAQIPGFDDVRDLIATGQDTTDKGLEAAIRVHKALADTRVRSHITLLVIRCYVIGLGLILAYIAIRGLNTPDDVFDNLIEVIKVGILPVVMLILGYYFGSSSSAR